MLGFDAGERARVMAGEIVTRGFDEQTDKELSVSLAMVVPVPMDRLLGELKPGGLLEHDRQILSYGVIRDVSAPDADFDALQFGAREADEIDALFNARPGSKINLDAGECARFEGLRRRFPSGRCASNPECAKAVASEYRQILKARLASYVALGPDGIAPYAREDGKRAAPGEELKTAASDLRPVSEEAGPLLRAFRDFPRGDQTLFESKFLWLEQLVQDRPAVILAHRVRHVEASFAFLAERQFYVGRSYNSLQVVAGLFPFEGKTFVFYLNRTSTDQVAGSLQGTRHSAGRKIMAKQIREHFEEIRKRL